MLPFFRKIRYRLANDNQFFKYSRYAVGEIVLVVVGILIALYINNWNEERKESILQRKILKEIAANIELDLIEIQEDISIMDSISNACDEVLMHLKTEDKPSKTFNYRMASIRANPHFDPNKSGYSLLVSKGLDIIKNDSLREYLSVLYESNYSYYRRYEEERTKFKIHHIYPQLIDFTKLQYVPDLHLKATTVVLEEDYERIKNNLDFEKLINAISYENKMVQDRALIIRSRIEGLRDLIRLELYSKKSK